MCRGEGSVPDMPQMKSMCGYSAEWVRPLPHLASGMVREEVFSCEKVPVTVFQDSDDLSRSVAHRIAALIAHKAEAGKRTVSASRLSCAQSWPGHLLSPLPCV